MKHLRKSLIFVLFVALSMCFVANAGAAEPKHGGTLSVASPATVSSLYSIAVVGNAWRFVYPAVERLGREQLDGTYKPFLCESWERDNDALTFTLKLRKGIKFSDGSELTADVVKWNLELMMKNGMGAALSNPKKFEVVDTHTLRVHFDAFSLSWENDYGTCFIYSQKYYETKGEDQAKIYPVGTGPFVLDQYVPDTYMRYKRNKNYWQKGLPYLDNYNIEIMPDLSTRQSAFVNDEIAYVEMGRAPAIKFLQSRGYKNKSLQVPRTQHYFVAFFNSHKKPFDNPEVRKAILLYGIDWKAIATGCAAGLKDFCSENLQMAIPGCYDYNPDIEKETAYDPAKAKAMLKKAGYGDGFETEIIFANPVYNMLGAALQDQLRRNFNITASVNLTRAAGKMRREGSTPGIYLMHVGGRIDPTNSFMTRLNRKGAFGKLMAFSDTYEAALDQVRATRTLEKKKSALRKLNRIFYVDDALGRVGYMTSDNVYIQDYVNDAGFESGIVTPELTWISK